MSPDEIFAAQFWPWPDPAVKRDATGRVLFVNAAFLQLYGGQPQDWHGNAVGGWPAPQAAGQSHRFETRIPGKAGGMGEQVYDWIEMVFQDGAAFALARNVTIFQTPPDPVPAEDPVLDVAPPVQQAVQAHVPPPVTAHEPAPVMESALSVDSTEAQAEYEAEYIDPVEVEAPVVDTPIEDIISTEQAVPQEVESDQPQERAYERRALPLESDSAVLGNNWRDAVIAKAVGAEPAQQADQDSEAPVDTIKPEIAAQATMSEKTTSTDDAGTDGGSRILLAEDNAINALLTRTLLEAEGHTVDTVEDGQLAVEAMKTNTYDLIFMDMRMPNMDGLEATRKIRALPNVSKDLPIVALTANAFDDDRNACFDSGMNDFMTKPVSAEELSDMVGNWTKGARQKIAS